MSHDRPCHPRQFVRQCNRYQHFGSAHQHASQPRPLRRAAMLLRCLKRRHGTDDQQAPQIALPHLRYLAQPCFGARRMLAWCAPDPSRKVASLAEHLWRCSQQRILGDTQPYSAALFRGCFLRVASFDTVSLARRFREGASTPSKGNEDNAFR